MMLTIRLWKETETLGTLVWVGVASSCEETQRQRGKTAGSNKVACAVRQYPKKELPFLDGWLVSGAGVRITDYLRGTDEKKNAEPSKRCRTSVDL